MGADSSVEDAPLDLHDTNTAISCLGMNQNPLLGQLSVESMRMKGIKNHGVVATFAGDSIEIVMLHIFAA